MTIFYVLDSNKWTACLHGTGPQIYIFVGGIRTRLDDCDSPWEWVSADGKSNIPFTYTNWDSEEPNCLKDTAPGNLPEACLTIMTGLSSWNDYGCSRQQCFVCEFPHKS